MIDAAFVRHWSERYPLGTHEVHLFDVVGPAVRGRGGYLRTGFDAVGTWKSPRSTFYLARNDDADVLDLTESALTAPLRLRHRVLGLLHGVGTPMASALLSVALPEEHTVMDSRAVETLRAHGLLAPGWPTYPVHPGVCQDVARSTGATLRELDRALWNRSKAQRT
ncbi:hypothetical protein ACI798_06945 [Geodermatophilus sp. SYSU D01045]